MTIWQNSSEWNRWRGEYIYIYIFIHTHTRTQIAIINVSGDINPLNAKLNPICHLLALLVAHLILHVSRIRVKRFG